MPVSVVRVRPRPFPLLYKPSATPRHGPSRDGVIDSVDGDLLLQHHGVGLPALPSGQISDSTHAGGPGNAVGYTGHLFDPDLGLYLARHRWYSPAQGRWVSRDPIGYLDGMNRYQYVQSSPKLYMDPNGLYPVPAVDTPNYNRPLIPSDDLALQNIKPKTGKSSDSIWAVVRQNSGYTDSSVGTIVANQAVSTGITYLLTNKVIGGNSKSAHAIKIVYSVMFGVGTEGVVMTVFRNEYDIPFSGIRNKTLATILCVIANGASVNSLRRSAGLLLAKL
ncbi:MAG: RHS repeat-associated core domain-containing protein [Phycisphaerales bacterium]|nr:MAG: RHS repeat-associated core domain-containing protein [Phycisphaerales bacterium]